MHVGHTRWGGDTGMIIFLGASVGSFTDPGAEQFPISSTGRDKCNTAKRQSIATSPNLHRKGSLPIDSYQFHDQFCMDLHSSTVKSWKQTSKTDQRPMCAHTSGCCSFPWRNESRSTLSAHTAVESHKTTCTISTLILLKPAVTSLTRLIHDRRLKQTQKDQDENTDHYQFCIDLHNLFLLAAQLCKTDRDLSPLKGGI